jgi:predicted nucleotidyltransferase
MGLTDAQIAKWSQRGDPMRAWFSYEIVKDTLTDKLNGMSCAIYPQGSYASKTNIVAESDVDLVVSLRSQFYPDKHNLNPVELAEYARHYEQASETWHDFREIVVKALKPDFFLQEGKKCVKVRSGLMRLSADVLIALDHRIYESFPSFTSQRYSEGVQFYTSADRKIINYPKRHVHSCRRKNDSTSGRFRPVVRVAKNARNELVRDDRSVVHQGMAPSYFLESLLWNVPDSCYRGDTAEAYRRSVSWLHEHHDSLADMSFPHQLAGLFADTLDTSWSMGSALTIIEGLHDQPQPQ